MAQQEEPTPVQLLIELARAIGMDVVRIGTSGLYVIRDGNRRVGAIRDEWHWRNAVPPPPRHPPQGS
jgi:hypothetical protein